MQKSFAASPSNIVNLRTALAAQRVTVPDGNSGEITGHGITVKFDYDGSSTLNLAIEQEPWYCSAGMIWDKVQAALG